MKFRLAGLSGGSKADRWAEEHEAARTAEAGRVAETACAADEVAAASEAAGATHTAKTASQGRRPDSAPLSSSSSTSSKKDPSQSNSAPQKKRAQSYWSVSWNIFKRNRLGMFCLVLVILLVGVAIFAPWLAPYNPDQQSLQTALQFPSAKHLFGTDEYGRDILSRIIYGCRTSLSVGVISQVFALLIGFFMGVSAGYFGGFVDTIISFIIQIFASFPFLLFAILVMFVLGPGLINLYVALALLMWTGTARLIRGDVMRIKNAEYIQSCKISGGKSFRVIIHHLLPNSISTLIVVSTLGIPGAILSEASLSFLGLGVQPPLSSWGSMISASQPYIQSNTYYSIIPGLAIIITVMAFNLLGDALRDALDPKLRS